MVLERIFHARRTSVAGPASRKDRMEGINIDSPRNTAHLRDSPYYRRLGIRDVISRSLGRVEDNWTCDEKRVEVEIIFGSAVVQQSQRPNLLEIDDARAQDRPKLMSCRTPYIVKFIDGKNNRVSEIAVDYRSNGLQGNLLK